MWDRIVDRFERAMRAQACEDGAHDKCPHMYGAAIGLNPRRLSMEGGPAVCKCGCHSGCPITSDRMTVSPTAWRESCTCPGSEDERIKHERRGITYPEPTDFREGLERERRQHRLFREAGRAVRAQAAGRTQAEIRDLYVSELRARGLEVPDDAALDAQAAFYAGDYVTYARLAGQSFAELVRDISGQFRGPR
jgi:hypothetical protein